MEDKVSPQEPFTTNLQLEGGERLKMETLGSELNLKTLKPGSVSQKCQMKGPVQIMNREW